MEVFVNMVGVTFRGREAMDIVKKLTSQDGDKLSLEAEPDNPHDSNAVKVIHNSTGMHIGYLARENNFEISQALQNGTDSFDIEIVGFENTVKPTLLISTMDDIPFTAEDFGEYPGER